MLAQAKSRERKLPWLWLPFAILLAICAFAAQPAQTATNHFVADQQIAQAEKRTDAVITTGIEQDIAAITDFLGQVNIGEIARAATTPVDDQVVAKEVAASPGAREARGPVIHFAGGTGQGQPKANYIANGSTVTTCDYAASVLPGLPPNLGPYSFAVSVQQGVDKCVANIKANQAVNPQAEISVSGPSQGEVVAQNTAAALPEFNFHLEGNGTPGAPGTGFVRMMPSQLLITQMGNADPIGPNTRADFYNLSGDLWANAPDVRNPLEVAAKLRSLFGTHYDPAAYANFKADEVYKVNDRGELDPNGNITMHTQRSENGLVLLANDLTGALGLPPVDEPTKQLLRDLAPEGTPGVRKMAVTPRELVENPSPENIVKFFTGKVDSTGRVVESGAPGLPDPAVMLEDAVDGLLQHPVGEAQAPAVQKAEAIPAPGPVNNPITEAAAPVIEMLPPEWQQPAEQVMDVVEAFVPQLAPPAPAQASAPVYEEASVPAYQAPQVMAPPAPADLVDAAATAAANAGVSSQVVSDVTNMVNGFLGVR